MSVSNTAESEKDDSIKLHQRFQIQKDNAELIIKHLISGTTPKGPKKDVRNLKNHLKSHYWDADSM